MRRRARHTNPRPRAIQAIIGTVVAKAVTFATVGTTASVTLVRSDTGVSDEITGGVLSVGTTSIAPFGVS